MQLASVMSHSTECDSCGAAHIRLDRRHEVDVKLMLVPLYEAIKMQPTCYLQGELLLAASHSAPNDV